MNHQLTIGIIGTGGFALFAAKSFLKVEGVRISKVTDINPRSALDFAREIDAASVTDLQEILSDPAIDLIYIATPPYLHYTQSKQALEAGKHVICEKPAALHADQARELAAFARNHKLLYVVNLMQRYNPLYKFVDRLINEKWLGDFVHGFFENYASDEKLTPAHWFWKGEESGGIFVEHGVHFFDMFHGWFGPGQLVHAMEFRREYADQNIIDRVQAVVLYQNSPVNFYHGFNQPKALDRQELRLQFDRGDLTLFEWVPVKVRIHGLFTAEILEKIRASLGNVSVELYGDSLSGQHATGKFREINYDVLATITSGHIADKMERYELLLISMLKDQWKWIIDRDHIRVIDDTNAVSSLEIAEKASKESSRF